MSTDEYERMTLVEMKKRKWRLARPVTTRSMVIPAGTVVEIVWKRNGLDVSAPPCPHCGVKVFIRKLAANAVDEIPDLKLSFEK